MTKVLIVGCGAVGQVFGLSLRKAGVTLGYLDRPVITAKLKQACEQGGLALFQVSHAHRRDPVPYRLDGYEVVADIAESQHFQPDQVWFTTPSQVYYSDWFREFLAKVPAAQVVCFIPEGPRPEILPEEGKERLVFGGTTFMAWQGNLENLDASTQGVTFWRPPLGVPLVGEEKACREVGQLLKKAGFRVTIGNPDSRAQVSATAVLTAFVAGLELAGWSLSSYRKSPWLRCAAVAAREAILSQSTRAGALQKALLGDFVLSTAFSMVTRLLPVLAPFDIQAYLHFHYQKTREQTLMLLELFKKEGERRGIGVENIQKLLTGMGGS